MNHLNIQSVNESQLEAIEHMDGPMLVVAGPGSGKTFVITRRISRLIEKGAAPEEILVITFTKAAAREMQERFQALMGQAYAPVNFGTFHAVFFHILGRECGYGASDLVTEADKRRLMLSAIRSAMPGEDASGCLDFFISEIARQKSGGEVSGAYLPDMDEQMFRCIYEAYEEELKEAHKLDFDDMVLKCRDLFRERPDILARWQRTYRYILIDEFQDINQAQYDVVRMLAEPERNLFVVGDDDQSIYGFRGSRPELMMNFPKEYPECRKVVLAVNYRSAADIVKASQELIGNNRERFEKKVRAGRPAALPVRVTSYQNAGEQVCGIVRMIREYRKNHAYNDMAVIIRMNRGAGLFTAKCNEEKIPYRFREKPVNLFQKGYGLDIQAYMGFLFDAPTRERLFRFMNKPVRYIKRSCFPEEMVDFYSMRGCVYENAFQKSQVGKLGKQLAMAGRMDLQSAYLYFMKAMGYEDDLRRKTAEQRREFGEVQGDLEVIWESIKKSGNYQKWMEYISGYEKSLLGAYQEEEEDAVNIVTMHGSKGLEYKIVFLPDLNEGIIPAKKADRLEELEEERRVLYVAMTRAKDILHMSYVEGEKENRLIKSRFLKQIRSVKREQGYMD